jgi:hypothetical protein
MKQKKIETHKIGLVGQAPSRRGDPRKPLAGPNGQKIARLAEMSYDELIACRRKHLNTTGGSAAKATRSTTRKATSTPPTSCWIGASSASSCSVRTWRAASASPTCLFWRRYAFMDAGSSSFRILLAPIDGGTNDETNDALDNFCSGSYGVRRLRLDSKRVDVPLGRGRRVG